ncbi:MAG: hypothetical protein ABIQ72_05820 [Usitatibacter sp.]
METSHALVKEVQIFLDQFALAVSENDGKTATQLWESPAIVLGDTMAMQVQSDAAVRKMFGSAKKMMDEMGVAETRAEILGLESLTPKVVMVTAHFDWINGAGEQVGGESTTFTLRRDNSGSLRVKSSVMHGQETN